MERLNRRLDALERDWPPIGCPLCRTWSSTLIRFQEGDGSFTDPCPDPPSWPHNNPCCPVCGRVPVNHFIIEVDPRGPG